MGAKALATDHRAYIEVAILNTVFTARTGVAFVTSPDKKISGITVHTYPDT